MKMKYLTVESQGNIAVVKISRAAQLNALNQEVLQELLTYLHQVELDKRYQALILTGDGDKAFIAGADIKEMSTMSNHEILQFCSLGQEVADALESASFLTCAAVQGYALGGGFEMALACDYIFASHEAKFGFPEVSLGIIPGFGGTQRLLRTVGTRLAKELIISGKTIDGKKALELHIANRLCDKANLIQECSHYLQSLTCHSELAIAKAKQAINDGAEMPLDVGLDLERNLFVECFNSPGRIEGFKRFLK